MVDKYICPKCGSDNWRMSNYQDSISLTENKPMHLVKNMHFLKTCNECGYTGIFLVKERIK